MVPIRAVGGAGTAEGSSICWMCWQPSPPHVSPAPSGSTGLFSICVPPPPRLRDQLIHPQPRAAPGVCRWMAVSVREASAGSRLSLGEPARVLFSPLLRLLSVLVVLRSFS